MACRNYIQIPLVLKNDNEQRKDQTTQDDNFDYLQREKWLRAAVLGADDGLVSVASLMMGVGLLKKDITEKIKPVVQGFLQLPLVLASSKGVHLIMAL